MTNENEVDEYGVDDDAVREECRRQHVLSVAWRAGNLLKTLSEREARGVLRTNEHDALCALANGEDPDSRDLGGLFTADSVEALLEELEAVAEKGRQRMGETNKQAARRRKRLTTKRRKRLWISPGGWLGQVPEESNA